MLIRFTNHGFRCLLAFLTTLSVVAASPVRAGTYIALTDGGTLEYFDAEGQFTGSRTLATGASSTSDLIGMSYADVLSSNADRELVVLRSDNNIEIYSDPTVGSGDMQVLQSNTLNMYAAERDALSIDVGNVDVGNAGLEMVVQTSSNSGRFLHTYSLPGQDGAILNRLGYSQLSGNYQSYGHIAVGEVWNATDGSEILAGGINVNFGDFFDYVADTYSNPDLGSYSQGNGTATAAKVFDDRIYSLLTDQNRLLVAEFDGSSAPVLNRSLDTDLDSSSTLVDFVIVPEPATLGLLGVGSVLLLGVRR